VSIAKIPVSHALYLYKKTRDMSEGHVSKNTYMINYLIIIIDYGIIVPR